MYQIVRGVYHVATILYGCLYFRIMDVRSLSLAASLLVILAVVSNVRYVILYLSSIKIYLDIHVCVFQYHNYIGEAHHTDPYRPLLYL